MPKRSWPRFTPGRPRTVRTSIPDLEEFARARGFVRRGGENDYHNAATAYMRALNEGTFGRFTFEVVDEPKTT